jgi:hypothetical protein
MAQDQKQKIQRRKTGLYVVWGGIATLALGYLFLAKGSITLAPILIIGSFVVMVVGIMLGWD